jgi:hypothetical protein
MALLERDVRKLADETPWPDRCARCTAGGTSLVPVPAKFAAKVDGLSVPLCPAHADDWAVVRRRSALGAFVILAGMAVVAATVWEVQPRVAAPANQNANSRFMATLMLGLVSAFPFGAWGLWWAKTPIRVQQTQGRLVTLAGVSGAFAKLVEKFDEPIPLPALPDEVRFEVTWYRPSGGTPAGVVTRFLVISALAGAVLGAVLGFAGRGFGRLAAGWQPNEWAYFGLTLLVSVAYLLPQFGFRFALSTRFGSIGLAAAVGVIALLALLGRAFGAVTFEQSFSVVFCAGASLLLILTVTGRYAWRWRVRTAFWAVVGGAGGPLLIVLVAHLIAGQDPGPHRQAAEIGVMAALAGGGWNLFVARIPYCEACDLWLVDRRIGALDRPKNEVVPVLAAGRIVTLARDVPYAAQASAGDVVLHVHSCSDCREKGTVVLELFEATAGGKSKSPTNTRVGRWQYPGAALPVIEKLFPPSEASPPP